MHSNIAIYPFTYIVQFSNYLIRYLNYVNLIVRIIVDLTCSQIYVQIHIANT
jgi:hypothetical protein